MQKKQKHENTTVVLKQKRIICILECWLNCQLASFEALQSLEKTIDDPTPSWSAVPFLRLVAEKRYPSGFVISYVFSYHINFFDYGDAALLLHCKTQQTTFKRIAQRKHLGPTELERVKEKQRRKQTQAIAAIAATGLSNYCSSRNGCFGRVVDVAGVATSLPDIWNGRVEVCVRKHKIRIP